VLSVNDDVPPLRSIKGVVCDIGILERLPCCLTLS